MSDFLKGNFETSKKIESETKEQTEDDLFENEAMKRLGGSIAFVSKKKFVWTGD